MDPTPLDGSNYQDTPYDLLQRGFRYALSLSHDTHAAEDLVQEAWFRLFRRYGFTPSRPLLFVTIRNLYIDAARRDRGRAFVSLEQSEDQLESTAPDPTAAGDLASVLGVLRPIEREVLYLHHVEGHSAEQISKLVGAPRNTVLSLLSRALKKLQVVQKD